MGAYFTMKIAPCATLVVIGLALVKNERGRWAAQYESQEGRTPEKEKNLKLCAVSVGDRCEKVLYAQGL